MKAEFEAAFVGADKNKSNGIDEDEYADFANRTYEHRKKRYGDTVKPDKANEKQWFDALNAITKSHKGISREDIERSHLIIKQLGTEIMY